MDTKDQTVKPTLVGFLATVNGFSLKLWKPTRWLCHGSADPGNIRKFWWDKNISDMLRNKLVG